MSELQPQLGQVRDAPVILEGVPLSPDIAAGPVFVLRAAKGVSHGPTGWSTLEAAAQRLADELKHLAELRRESSPSGAELLEAQSLILVDPALRQTIARRLSTETDAALAVAQSIEAHASAIEALDDPYLRSRANDIREIGQLWLDAALERAPSSLSQLNQPAVLLAAELSPTELLKADRNLLLGIVLERGGITSHVAIIARELGLAGLVGVPGLLAAAENMKSARINGASGTVELLTSVLVAIRPSKVTAHARRTFKSFALMANVGSEEAAIAAVAADAHGIGLFRTELMFLDRDEPMAEAEQAAIYASACSVMDPYPVVVRTLDLGSDKMLPYLQARQVEPNPALGERGIRMWLANSDLCRTQIAALVSASQSHSNLNVMLPMVSSRREVEAARELFRQEAERQGVRMPPIGVMIEVPAMALALHTIAGLVEFVSLGTNDLAQYASAADRELAWDEDISEFHPGTLRLIATALKDSQRLGLRSSVCGDMAARPAGAIFLLGAGVQSLSVPVASLDMLGSILEGIGMAACRDATRRALQETNARDAVTALESIRTRPHRRLVRSNL